MLENRVCPDSEEQSFLPEDNFGCQNETLHLIHPTVAQTCAKIAEGKSQ
jgi:hypothetical protein